MRCSVASNPEFLREGSAVEDFLRPDRVVIGADDPEAIAILKDLYKPLNLIEVPFVITNVATAELIKYASNAFLATKISFINEISALCEAVGADVHDVSRAMGLDGRIGRKFLHPGPGYGGSCFPKDTLSLVQFSREFGVEQRIVAATVARQRRAARAHDHEGREAGRQAARQDDRRARAVVQAQHRRRARLARDLDDPGAAGGAARTSAATTPRRWRPPRASSTAWCSARTPTTPPRAATRWSSLTEWNEFRKLDLGAR